MQTMSSDEVAIMKKLQDLTLQELYELFPIELKEYNEDYPNWFIEKRNELFHQLGSFDITITHIGSTAITGIISKPIIDILCEVYMKDVECVLQILNKDWVIMSKRMSPLHISLNQGYTIDGYADKVFHLHIQEKGDNNQIHFKDVLNQDEILKKEYEDLKKRNLEHAKLDRDLYTNLKKDFVEKVRNIKL